MLFLIGQLIAPIPAPDALVQATSTCRCEHMNARATAIGTCTKAEREGAYCRITFNGGDAAVDRDFIEYVEHRPITQVDVAAAAEFLTLESPEQWQMDLTSLRLSLQALLVVQTGEVEPTLIDDVAQLVELLPTEALKAFAYDVGDERYEVGESEVTVEVGAIAFSLANLSLQLRTPVAREEHP